jgi:hypothetical protein
MINHTASTALILWPQKRDRYTTVASGPKTRQMGKDGVSHSTAVRCPRRFGLPAKPWNHSDETVHGGTAWSEQRATKYLTRAVSCATVSKRRLG